MIDATQVLAERAVNWSVDPSDRAIAGASLLDTSAACVAGAATGLARRVRRLAQARTGVDAEPTGEWLAFELAARAQATQLTDQAPFGSAGAAVWPALWALTPADDPIATSHLDAFAVAITATAELWRTGRYLEAERGLHGGQAFGTVAAALACARLLELGVDETIATIAIAASSAGGVVANLGTDAGELSTASAARAGVRAATLAARGYRGSAIALGGRQGFGEAFFGIANGALPELADRLDAAATLSHTVRFRRLPVHISAHRAATALHELIEADSEPASEVIVDGVSPVSPTLRFPMPTSAAEAALSLPFSLATLIEDGEDGLLGIPFADSELTPPRSLERLTVLVDSRWQGPAANPAHEPRSVRVRTAAGVWHETVLERTPASIAIDLLGAKWRAAGAALDRHDPATADHVRDLADLAERGRTVAPTELVRPLTRR